MDIVYNPTTITQVKEFLTAPLTDQNAVHQLKQELQTQTTAELKNRIGGILEGEKVRGVREEWLKQEGGVGRERGREEEVEEGRGREGGRKRWRKGGEVRRFGGEWGGKWCCHNNRYLKFYELSLVYVPYKLHLLIRDQGCVCYGSGMSVFITCVCAYRQVITEY